MKQTSHNSGRGPVKTGSDRSFGFIFAFVFLVVGVYPAIILSGEVRVWSVGLAGILIVVTSVRPKILRLPNVCWTKLGNLLGRIATPVVLALIFYVVLTPIAILMRTLGHDQLRLKRPESYLETYWITRNDGSGATDMSKQF